MFPLLNGMAVLFIYLAFIILSYQILSRVDWRKLFTQRDEWVAQWLCVLLSIAVGHSVSSFFITIIDILRNLFLSVYY